MNVGYDHLNTTATPSKLGVVNMTLANATYNQTGVNAALTSTSETVAALTLDSGANTITLTEGSSGAHTSTTFKAASITRNNNAELFVRSSNLLGSLPTGSTNSELVTITSAPTGSLIGGGGAFGAGSSTISILPYMVGSNSATAAPNSFVGYDTTNNSLRVLNTTAGATSEYTTLALGTGTSNVRNSSTSAAVAVTAGTYNSLILDSGTVGTPVTDTIGAGGITLNNGALLFSRSGTTARATTLTGGTLQAAASNVAGSSSTELIITNAIGASLRINSQISGSGGLTLNSYADTTASPIILGSTSNNYTGTTTINGGTLQLGAAGVIPDGSTVDVSLGSLLDLNGNSETIDALAGGGTVDTTLPSNTPTLTVGSAGGSGTFSGLIQNLGGAGATVTVNKTGAGTETFTGANNYFGGTLIAGGMLVCRQRHWLQHGYRPGDGEQRRHVRW